MSKMDDYSDDSDISIGEGAVIRPYQFEPMRDLPSDEEASSLSSENESDYESDALDTEVDVDEWCDCNYCIHMPTPNERRCCKRTHIVDQKCDRLPCITHHEGFQANCLNIHVLEASYYDYVIDHGQREEDQPIHELYRYLAYRRFTRWIYGLLPNRCRKVIPACAVKAIRERFPSEEYCGFKYPE